MTPTQIKTVLAELGGGPNKRLGQNFLIDPQVLETIVETAAPAKAGKTLEIGPGLGVLTCALLIAGHDVISIERDRRFVAYLEKTIPDERFALVQGDAADVDWHTHVDGSWSLVSNLPYSISSLALRKALWAVRPASHVVVLVQREVGERAIDVAGRDVRGDSRLRGKTSLLSLMVALSCASSRIVRKVPPGAFFPPPKVESCVLELVPMPWDEREKVWGIHPDTIMRVAKAGFSSPRKKMASNLRTGLDLSDEVVQQAFSRVGLDPNVRAEDISPGKWAILAKALSGI
jgi:16S rRNA (adenine1518-N6/adenine1519-N6)-dimethyltransferase